MKDEVIWRKKHENDRNDQRRQQDGTLETRTGKKVNKNMDEEKPYKKLKYSREALCPRKKIIRTCVSTPVSLQENFVTAATGATKRGLRSFACIPNLLPWRI